jgi:hypothetical protein
LATPGVILGAEGTAYATTVRRSDRLRSLSIAPMLDRRSFGLALSGRF